MMDVKAIKTKKAYKAALKKIEELMRTGANGDLLDVLVILVEAYEDEHYPMSQPDPIIAIRFHMDQTGLKQKDLIPYFGSASRVSEVLNRQRPLTLQYIQNLHEGLGIPIESLTGRYELDKRAS